MAYPPMPDLANCVEQLTLYSQLQHEYGAQGIPPILAKAEKALLDALHELKSLPIDPARLQLEPSDLASIRALRPAGPRRIWQSFADARYRDKLEGALLGRMAGCTLGAPVEFWPIEKMEALAQENGDVFPPRDYWRYVPEPFALRYQMSPRAAYTRTKMDGVPVDDDLIYTLLGLLVVEKFGPDFTTEENGLAWLQYLPHACTAEAIALQNLKAGIPATQAAEKDNPYCDWIGADIRADPWGYLAAGWPELAADMAYRDAYLSHRRQGLYGAMFFAAAIAAAFTVTDPVDALRIGLTEIPANCALSQAIRWALAEAPQIHSYREARQAVDDRFKGMSGVHTINNACLTIFGIAIGRTDLTRVIGETVAMGLDNDCTAATAGSLVGAVIGKEGIPEHWYRKFNNTIYSYLIGQPSFAISGLVERFSNQTRQSVYHTPLTF